MSITHQNDTAAEDYDDVDAGPSAGEPATRPAPRLADQAGSDDVEAAYRQWALDQVTTGQLTRDEAVQDVPGAAHLIDNSATAAGYDDAAEVEQEGPAPSGVTSRWYSTAEALAGAAPADTDSVEYWTWVVKVLDTSPVHLAFEDTSVGDFDQFQAVWNQHQHVQDLLRSGQVDSSQVTELYEGEHTWFGLADQDNPLLAHLTYTGQAVDCDDL